MAAMIEKALLVFMLDPKLRTCIAENDPKAYLQMKRALLEEGTIERDAVLAAIKGQENVEPTKLSGAAQELLAQLQRKDLDYTHVDEAAYRELRQRGLANVIFSSTGNRVFATSAGKAR